MKHKTLGAKSLKSSPEAAEVKFHEVALENSTILYSAEPSDNYTQPQFVICLDNTDYGVSLEKGKVYQVIPDADASSFGAVRIVDETGEDYLFPARRFAPITLPQEVQDVLLAL